MAQINLLKTQMQIRQPDKRVCLSEKCKKKSVQELCRELEKMIEDETEYAKMKLTVGTNVNHRLKESDNIEEYKGQIMRASTDSVTIEYEGYEDLFTWTFQELLEDFYKGDLSLVP